MREILFHGKCVDNGEWVEGYFAKKYFQELPHDRYVIQYKTKYDVEKWKPDYMVAEVIPETVGQYTGLHDSTKWEQLTVKEQSEWLKHHNKNEWIGKKIFEGDIVSFGVITGIINYNYGCYCVKTNKPDWKCRNNPAIDIVMNEYPNEIEVIGNIHDNKLEDFDNGR